MSRRKGGAFGKLGRATKDRRRKRREFGASIAAGLTKSADRMGRRASNNRWAASTGRAFLNKLTPNEYYQERERMEDDLERNPKRVADEIAANRISGVGQWLRNVFARLRGVGQNEK
jgi:hypothetical protein